MPNKDPEGNEYQPRWNELITLQEAAKFSGLSYSHLRRIARQGDIWARKLGNNWFTTEQAVKSYLVRERRPGPKVKKDP